MSELLRRVICWFIGHRWERHPTDDYVLDCFRCGASKELAVPVYH